MPPADSASRAGAMPKASGDRSSRTFVKNMKTAIIAVVIAIIFGISGYIFGGYIGVTRMARASNYATLMWLTNIDKDLQQGNIDRAKKLTFQATDATFGVLERIDTTPESALLAVVPWDAFNIKAFNEHIAIRAKQHFALRLDEFSDASKNNIQKIVEVELPQSKCPSPVKK